MKKVEEYTSVEEFEKKFFPKQLRERLESSMDDKTKGQNLAKKSLERS